MHFNDKPSIISLSESWIKQSDNLSVFAIHGYDFISNPRKKKSGGGVGFYVSNNLSYIVHNDSANNVLDDVCDHCIIELINDKSPNMIIISLYKPPDSDLSL